MNQNDKLIFKTALPSDNHYTIVYINGGRFIKPLIDRPPAGNVKVQGLQLRFRDSSQLLAVYRNN